MGRKKLQAIFATSMVLLTVCEAASPAPNPPSKMSSPAANQPAPASTPQRIQQPTMESMAALQKQVQPYLQTYQNNLANTQQVNQRQQTLATSYPQQIQQNKQISTQVNNQIRQSYPQYGSYFSNQFFGEHNYLPYYTEGWTGNYWGAPTWNQFQNWVGWNNPYPYYYDAEGYPLNVSNYTPQVGAVPAPQAVPIQGTTQWLPLGVFAVGETSEAAASSPTFIQLAISKDGEVAGTYYNAVGNTNYPLEGGVDPKTQQIYWELPGYPNAPIITTGLYNLLQDVSNIQLHYANGSTLNWVLVRVSPPSSA